MQSTQKFLRRRIAVAVLLCAALVATVFVLREPIRSVYDVVTGADFSGSGTEEVLFTIKPGDSGDDIARALVESGVTATFGVTYRELLKSNAVFYPGDYKLRTSMSASAAVSALLNDANLVQNSVLIKEGYRVSQIFEQLNDVYGVEISELESVTPKELGLPSEAVNLDGYLFPATYVFSESTSGIEMLKSMWARMQQELSDLGVAQDEVHATLTMAGLVQREGRNKQDFGKMARTFYNRIEVGMHLQSDATVSYAFNSQTVSTTAAQRADDNPWNTYRYPGLPAGPISAPGRDAILAAISPTPGDWLFFCTVNLETGETEFNATYAGHEVSVAKWQAWMRANPGWE